MANETQISSKTLSVPEAGRIYFGTGRNKSYDLAAEGTLPTIRVGGRLRCLPAACDRKLEQMATAAEGRARAQ